MDTKKIETVLTTVTIDSKVDSGKIDVVVGESAKMDVVKAVNYIQSGKAEIEAGVTEVLNQVDNHVAEKTAEFDQNAQDKTGDFNDNYTAKKALIDAEVAVAEGYSAEAKQWAIGDPTEPADGSAKYWAEQASHNVVNDGQLDIQVNGSSVATFTANQSGNTTANIVVPDSATWGNINGTLSDQTDLQNALNGKYDASNPNGYITGISSSDVTTALGYTPVNPSSLSDVATSGDYDDLTNKPTIPTVGNGTITINQGGVQKGTFTTNQSGNTSIDLDSGGTVDQTYDATSTNAQSGVAIAGELANYTPTSSLASVAISGDYSDLSGTPSITIQKVNSLPANPSSSILYCIPES